MGSHRAGNKGENEYRKLPSVDALLRLPEIALLGASYSQSALADIVRRLVDDARGRVAQGFAAPEQADWLPMVAERLALEAEPTLRPVINATGVILHTNLGRAPLSRRAQEAIASIAAGYSNLEYDLAAGERGSRHDHLRQLLSRITGAQDAMIVNNNAAAVYLVLAALCRDREVLISRGQLVEIGGGYRIPDVLRQSGAHMVEVGTTNRTHAHDFSAAMGERTAAILRVHSSNFRQVGFVTMPTLSELATLAHDANRVGEAVLLIDDLGSGSLIDSRPFGLAPEPMVQESLRSGADLVLFSGDKLLGGPQAGLIVGRADLIAQLRAHPMARALRIDKLTLAALDATLRSYLAGSANREIPIWQMISASLDVLHERANEWRAILRDAGIEADVEQGESAVGGGSLPGETLPTWLLALVVPQPESVATALRALTPAIVCRIQKDRLLFDPRTVLAAQNDDLLRALRTVCQSADHVGRSRP